MPADSHPWSDEDVERAVVDQCEKQGIPARVTDPVVRRRVATIVDAAREDEAS